DQGRRWMAAPLLVFSAAFVWHDSPLLTAANLVALAGAVSLGALRRTQTSPTRAGVGEYAAALASAGAGSFAGAVHLLHREVPWQEAERVLRGRRSASIGRGLALGAPLVALFGGLFIAADAVFKNLVTSAVPNLSRVWPHLFFAAALGWAAAGLLRDLIAAKDDRRVFPADSLLARRLSLGATEVAVALGALVLLFAAFVAVQARYLFGGSALVQARALDFEAAAALNLVNRDAVMARANLPAPRVAAAYLGALSDDAVPALLSRWPSRRQPLRVNLARLRLARAQSGYGVLDWSRSR